MSELSGLNIKQDGRLTPAYFSQEYKYFDQYLPTVKNETTVQNLVSENFLQTSIPPLISIFYAKEGVSQLFVQNILSHNTQKFRLGTLQCIRKFWVAKNILHRGGEASRFCRKFFHLTGPKKLRQGTILYFRKFLVGKNI